MARRKKMEKDPVKAVHAQFEREAAALTKDHLNFQGEIDRLLDMVTKLEDRILVLENKTR